MKKVVKNSKKVVILLLFALILVFSNTMGVSASETPPPTLLNDYTVTLDHDTFYTAVNEFDMSVNEGHLAFYFGNNPFTDFSAGGLDCELVLYDGVILQEVITLSYFGWYYIEVTTLFDNAILTLVKDGYDSTWGTALLDYTFAYDDDNIPDMFTTIKTVGYIEGQDDLYTNGSDEYDYPVGDSYNYTHGYSSGQTDIRTNGSVLYGFSLATSKDYVDGKLVGHTELHDNGSEFYILALSTSHDYIEGTETVIDERLEDFNSGFEDWIVPVIVLVLFVGGFFSLIAMKKGRD